MHVYGVHTGNQSRSQSMPVRGLCSGTREQAYWENQMFIRLYRVYKKNVPNAKFPQTQIFRKIWDILCNQGKLGVFGYVQD